MRSISLSMRAGGGKGFRLARHSPASVASRERWSIDRRVGICRPPVALNKNDAGVSLRQKFL